MYTQIGVRELEEKSEMNTNAVYLESTASTALSLAEFDRSN